MNQFYKVTPSKTPWRSMHEAHYSENYPDINAALYQNLVSPIIANSNFILTSNRVNIYCVTGSGVHVKSKKYSHEDAVLHWREGRILKKLDGTIYILCIVDFTQKRILSLFVQCKTVHWRTRVSAFGLLFISTWLW